MMMRPLPTRGNARAFPVKHSNIGELEQDTGWKMKHPNIEGSHRVIEYLTLVLGLPKGDSLHQLFLHLHA